MYILIKMSLTNVTPLLLTTYLIQMFSRIKNLTTGATLLAVVSAAPFKIPFIMTLRMYYQDWRNQPGLFQHGRCQE